MMRWVLSVGILVFWLAMSLWLGLREGLFLEDAGPSYQTLLRYQLGEQYYRMAILVGGERVGWTSTRISGKPQGGYRIETATHCRNLLALPVGEFLRITSEVNIDEKFLVQSFFTHVTFMGTVWDVQGEVSGHELHVRSVTPDGKENVEVLTFEDHNTLSNGISPFLAMPRLSVGKRWAIQMMDPIELVFSGRIRARQAIAIVEEKENLFWAKEEVFRVRVEFPGVQRALHEGSYYAWITADGRILQEQLPLGIRTVWEADKDSGVIDD